MDQDTPITAPESSPVEKAEKVLKELNEKIASAEAKIKGFQDIEARAIIAGKANAGTQPAQQKEETPQEYAKRVSKGGQI